ncbi:MAG: peptidoglycan-binding protein [Beijerinckiaceae bacterium]|nr:peptidoglycan-binding protein [Beijerinckiaceae bacterium]
MREALARADYDFSVSEEPPRRRARPRDTERMEPVISRVPEMTHGDRSASASRLGGLAAVVLRRPLRTLVGLACGAIAFSFVANLLFMQSGPHPAPFFAKPEAKQDARLVAKPDAASAQRVAGTAAQPQAAAQPVASSSRSAPPSVAPAPPVRPVDVQKPAAKQPEFDPIAQFLRGGSSPGSAPATTASTNAPAPVDAKRVSAAQRALAKLGHKVDADGLMGPGTRAAIQKFERDAKLPVTGELNQRTVSALSARASIAIP